MTIAKTVAAITQHAINGPSAIKGQKVQNTLSPAFGKLTEQLIRGHVIQTTQAAEATVAASMLAFREHLPAALYNTYDQLAAQVNEAFHTIYK